MPRFRPMVFPIGLIAGFFEKVEWTGFATSRLLESQTSPRAGFQLGLIWALWHALADFAGNFATMGSFWHLSFGLFWLAALPACRMLMTWVYTRTRSAGRSSRSTRRRAAGRVVILDRRRSISAAPIPRLRLPTVIAIANWP
jgi:hypothetical protein